MIQEGDVQIRIREADYLYTTDFVILKKQGGKLYKAKLEFVEVPEGTLIDEPTLTIEDGKRFLQSLRGELRRLGYAENADQATVLALKDHLADMRKLVFEKPQPFIVSTDFGKEFE